MTVRVRIDRDRCQGHNRCRALAPEVFDVDELGYGVPISEEVSGPAVDRARLAERNCPERAICVVKVSDEVSSSPPGDARAQATDADR